MQDLSNRLQMDLADLRSEVEEKSEPKLGILGKIAHELSLPKFAFFMGQPLDFNGVLPDFRSNDPVHAQKSRQTVDAIQAAQAIQRTAITLAADNERDLPIFTSKSEQDIERFASDMRGFFNINVEDQRAAKDQKAFYTLCRKRIEEKGIFIIHSSFPPEDGSGFCLYDRRHPVIVINTKQQTRARRLFTLVHEVAHILMGQSGISDPFVRNNIIERRCNRFAAAFLVPKSFVKTLVNVSKIPEKPDADDVSWLSRRLKISQEATVLRLEQLGLISDGSYSSWLALVKSRGGNPDYFEKSGGSGSPPPQEKTKLAKYGFHFAEVFSSLLDRGKIDPINLYRSTGLKPSYQRSYFQYAKSLSSGELDDLDLDDE